MGLAYKCSLVLIVACGLITSTAPFKQEDASNVPCPAECRCETTDGGLHKANCFNTQELYKYSLKNKHHNINIIDLSFSNVSKINSDLDRFTEMVSLDLSHNEIQYVTKFLLNSRKLVHLNLAYNKLTTFSASHIPGSVSSLDLRHNRLHDIPADIDKLNDLEHLLLEGNPLNCSCENVKLLNSLRKGKVVMDDVVCAFPQSEKQKIWYKTSILKECKYSKHDYSDEMMLGDEPEHETISPLSSSKKSMEMVSSSDAPTSNSDDTDLAADNSEFLFPKDYTKASTTEEEPYQGSGDAETTPEEKKSEDIKSLYDGAADLGSGYDYEGSGDLEEEDDNSTIPTLYPIDVPPELDSSEFNNSSRPSIFMGGKPDWELPPDEVMRRKVAPTQESPNRVESSKNENSDDDDERSKEDTDTVPINENMSDGYSEESRTPQKTSVGTYICIGLIIALLIGLILITLIKGQIRKNRDQRQIRQQRTDIEKAGKEMVDMNKSLLGKPAVNSTDEKKVNGKYELVPTHDKIKKPENGNVEKRNSTAETPLTNTEHPDVVAVPNGNKAPSSIDKIPHRLEDSPPVVNMKPLKSEYEHPHTNGTNGYAEPDSQDYLPIIPAQESGRVKIKLTETLKPKTPVLITRSRSNAGDIIITPAADQSPIRKNPAT